jgi:hypothetical protein
MSKIRMNTELRTKILNRYRDHAEKEITQELVFIFLMQKKTLNKMRTKQ